MTNRDPVGAPSRVPRAPSDRMSLANESRRLPPSAKLALALVVLAVGVAQGFGRFTYALILPAIERDMLHSYSLAGWYGTANLTAYLVGVLCVSLAAARFVDAERLVLAPDCGMKYLPRDTAFGKLAAMTQAAEKVRAEL